MLGAIAGDIIGSPYEFDNVKNTDFALFFSSSVFTDDTVLTVAIADSILSNKEYGSSLLEYANRYPQAGYGSMFTRWFQSDTHKPYNSFGNGAAMRVTPIGFAFDTIDEVLKEARRSAEVTHNHPEGVKGAQATAAVVFLARKGETKHGIKHFVETKFKYDLSVTLDDLRPTYKFNETCQGTVPQAITAFLESQDFEDAIRKAVSLGGDSDTLACITGGIAEAFYKKIPQDIIKETRERLPKEFLRVVDLFENKYLVL